jgi:hypothetical protein
VGRGLALRDPLDPRSHLVEVRFVRAIAPAGGAGAVDSVGGCSRGSDLILIRPTQGLCVEQVRMCPGSREPQLIGPSLYRSSSQSGSTWHSQ